MGASGILSSVEVNLHLKVMNSNVIHFTEFLSPSENVVLILKMIQNCSWFKMQQPDC